MARPSSLNTHFWCIALGTWLGIHALRSYIAMAVWNLGDSLPVVLKGIPPAAVFLLGLLAAPARKWLGGNNPSLRFACVLALLGILRQASLANDMLAIVFSFGAWIVWMWWLPAAVKNAAADDALSMVAPAVTCGCALQLALQAALHGLDLPLLPSWPTVPAASVLAGAFVLATRAALQGGSDAAVVPDWNASPGSARVCAGAARGLVAFGPWFFLQLTLLANLGRIAEGMAWSQTAAAAFLTASLLLAAVATLYPASSRVRWALGVFAVLWLPVLYRAGSVALWLIPLAQIALALLLVGAFAPMTLARAPSGWKPSLYGGAVAGMVLFFVLLFVFYNAYELPVLWPLAIAGVAALGVAAARSEPQRARAPLGAVTALATLGVALSALGTAAPKRPVRAPADVRVMTFNVHQGYDYRGLPSLPQIARTIEQTAPDLAGLQEVNRGWDMLGGIDVVGWLRWRLPMYEVIYGPTHRAMWGNAILSRYAVVRSGSSPFGTQAASFHYGFAWVRMHSTAGGLSFVTAHLAPQLTGGTVESRAAQAGELSRLLQPHTVVTGDFNSDPDDVAIRQTVQSGTQDLGAAASSGNTLTSPVALPAHRIDYIFATPDVSPLSVAVLQSRASDHLAVVANVRLK